MNNRFNSFFCYTLCAIIKKYILFPLFLAFCLITKAEDNQTNLVVWVKDGTKVTYLLAEKPKVTFAENDLVITSKGVVANYSLETIARITYEDNTYTDVNKLQTDESVFKLDGEFLLFHNLKANSTISFYTPNGILVFKKIVGQNGEYVFPLSNLNTGVNVINVNGKSFKIVKR